MTNTISYKNLNRSHKVCIMSDAKECDCGRTVKYEHEIVVPGYVHELEDATELLQQENARLRKALSMAVYRLDRLINIVGPEYAIQREKAISTLAYANAVLGRKNETSNSN